MPDHDSSLPYLRESLLFLALAGVLIPVLKRYRISPVFGFLALGALLGPFGLGSLVPASSAFAYLTFPRMGGVIALAELGVLFLMFSIGLELSFERLAAMRRWVLGAGIAQMLVTGLVIAGVATLFGNSVPTSLIIGFALAFSSTALVMQLLAERQESATRHGRAAFGVLLLQDLAVVPLLILADVFSKGGNDVLVGATLAMLKGIAAVVLIYVVGRKIVRPAFHAVVQPGQPDAFFALTMLTTLSIASLTWAAGLSMALGAFLAGLLLAETEFRHEIEASIESFRGLLLGLFFFTIGMGFDFRALAREPVFLPASVAGLFLVKTLILVPILRWSGLDLRRSIIAGALLGQAGEFGFVVVAAGTLSGLIPREVGQFMLLIIGLSLFATPLVDRIARLVGVRLEARDRKVIIDEVQSDETFDLDGHIVIAGFGRVGRMLGHLMEHAGIAFVALDQDPDVVARERARGYQIHFGDASRPELLRRFHLERATAVIVTMNHPAHALRTVRALRREYPQITILARAHDREQAQRLRAEGANAAIPETLESTMRLGSLALETAGIQADQIEAAVEAERQRALS